MNDAILITGGTGKIGSRLVEHFHSLGRTVVFTSRSDEKIAKTIVGRERLHGIKVDFTRESAAEEVETESDVPASTPAADNFNAAADTSAAAIGSSADTMNSASASVSALSITQASIAASSASFSSGISAAVMACAAFLSVSYEFARDCFELR